MPNGHISFEESMSGLMSERTSDLKELKIRIDNLERRLDLLEKKIG